MSNNHIIIGLGGTGGKIIREFRKMIYQQHGTLEPDGVALGYIYMDTDESSMRIDDSEWKVLGKSVQLSRENQVLLTAGNLRNILQNIELYQHIEGWIGDRKIWDSILGESTKVFGGQKRRLGRFLFACNTGDFLTALGRQHTSVVNKSGMAQVTFNIVCGLAGGTGSGTVVDVVAQIRRRYPNSKVILHCLLPERNPKPTWDTGNYHANGYAALMELNAMSVGRYSPISIDPENKGRIAMETAFNGCYLFGDTNENGKAVDVSEEIPSVIAAFLYQKIVATRGQNWDTLKRMENAENGDLSPEEDFRGKPERSRRFLSFGIKRVAIPKKEIEEYMTFNYAQQSLLQLRYNHWSDSQGFMNVPMNHSWKSHVEEPKNKRDWKISDEHLTLSLPVLASDEKAKWNPVDITWSQIKPRYIDISKEAKNSDDWLNRLEGYMNSFYNEGFRGVGVTNFYKAKAEDRLDIAREIRQNIEKILFEQWQNGQYAMHDIKNIIDIIYSEIDSTFNKVDEKILRFEEALKIEESKIKDNRVTYNNVGLWGEWFSKKDKLLNAQADCLQKYHTFRTQIQAWNFAKVLLGTLKLQLDDLVTQIKEATAKIEQAYVSFEEGIKIRMNDRATEDLNESLIRFYEPEVVKNVVRKLIQNKKEQTNQTNQVRQKLVALLGNNLSFTAFNKSINSNFLVDKLQEECKNSVRIAHSEILREDSEKVLHGKIIDKLAEKYRGKDTDFKKFIDELIKRAGNYINFDNDEITRQVQGVMGVNQSKLSAFSFIMPPWAGGREPAPNTFEEILKNTLEENVPVTTQAKSFLNHEEEHEFVIVSMTNLFPIRFVREVRYLKEKYEARVRTGERAKVEVHTEGDASFYPNLYTLDMTDIRKMEAQAKARQEFLDKELDSKIEEILSQQSERIAALLLLGRTIGLIEKEKDRKGKEKESSILHIKQFDSDGFDADPIELDKTLVSSLDKLKMEISTKLKTELKGYVSKTFAQEIKVFSENEALTTNEAMLDALQTILQKVSEKADDADMGLIDKIEKDVLEDLNKKYPDTEKRHDKLRPDIMAKVEDVKVERGGSPKDEVYKTFVGGAKMAFKILKDEE